MEYRKAFTLRDGDGKEYEGSCLRRRLGDEPVRSLEDMKNPPKNFEEEMERMA